jgi:hypothetical protein
MMTKQIFFGHAQRQMGYRPSMLWKEHIVIKFNPWDLVFSCLRD